MGGQSVRQVLESAEWFDYPTGLRLPARQLHLFWVAENPNLPPYVDALQGTAEEAERYEYMTGARLTVSGLNCGGCVVVLGRYDADHYRHARSIQDHDYLMWWTGGPRVPVPSDDRDYPDWRLIQARPFPV